MFGRGSRAPAPEAPSSSTRTAGKGRADAQALRRPRPPAASPSSRTTARPPLARPATSAAPARPARWRPTAPRTSAYLPLRDRGPVRRYVRDLVDRRRNVGQYFLPVAFAVLFLAVVPNQTAILVSAVAMYTMLGILVLDCLLLSRTVKKAVAERFGETAAQERGLRLVRRHAGHPDAPDAPPHRQGPPRRGAPPLTSRDAPPVRVRPPARCLIERMDYRHLGRSGLVISEIIYGNWLTHGSQVENDAATACVHAALDVGITTFDTADVYANTAAETVLGEALKGQRRESLEILTKVYWPTGPKGHNDTGLGRKHVMESIDGSLTRLKTDYVDLYQAHRFDVTTPLEETMSAFADVVHSGKAHYIGVSEWTADQIRQGAALARGAEDPVRLQPAAVLDAVAGHRGGGRPDLAGARARPDRLVAHRPGRAHRQVRARPAAARGLPRHRHQGRRQHDRPLHERRRPRPRAGAQARRRRARPVHGPARRGLGAPERQRVRRDHRRLPPRAGHRERQGRRGRAARRGPWRGSTRSSATSSSATPPRPSRACRRGAPSPPEPPARTEGPRPSRTRALGAPGATQPSGGCRLIGP